MGAGISGNLTPSPAKGAGSSPNPATLEDLTVSPGVAPWVSGRVGLLGSNEGGLSYTGRSIRLDARHAFDLGGLALSVGIGGSAVTARRPEGSTIVLGGGADVPVLLGFRSRSDLYSLWLGPRAGFEVLSGELQGGAADGTATDVSARHYFAGGTLGVRIGFRNVYGAVEVTALYHHAEGTLQGTSTSIQQFSIAPAGALIALF